MVAPINGATPKVVHQVAFGLTDQGQILAQSSADPLLTMKIIGMGQAALADMFVQKAQQRIVEAPPGLTVPRG